MKNPILLFLGMSLLLIIPYACNDDPLGMPSDSLDNIGLINRSEGDLSFSFELNTVVEIELKEGSLDQLLKAELVMLQEPREKIKVNAIVGSEGSLCFEFEKHLYKYSNNGEGGNGGEFVGGFEFKSKTEVCNGNMEYTSIDTTYSEPLENENQFWVELLGEFAQTPEEKKALLMEMITNLQGQSGVNVEETSAAFVITSILPTGESLITYFDKVNYELGLAKLMDVNGSLNTRIDYHYTCTDNGLRVPGSYRMKSFKKSMISKQAYVRSKWFVFDQFQLSI